MDPRIKALVDEQHGAFSAAEAAARGIDATALRSASRAGQIMRVRRAAYVDRAAMLERLTCTPRLVETLRSWGVLPT